MDNLILPNGKSLTEESKGEKLLFVLVRHSGCTFCRESLAQLSKHKKKILNEGYKPYVVHMGTEDSGEKLKKEYDLAEVEFVSDSNLEFYDFFGARKGNLVELFGPKVWLKGFVDGVVKGHGVGALNGDGFQMGGVYLVEDATVSPLHIPKNAGDVENWNTVLREAT